MKIFLISMFFTTATLYADKYRAGMSIDAMKREMIRFKYAGGDRDFIYGGFDSYTYSSSWKLEQGTLTVAFDEKTREITSLTYWLSCDPGDPFRKSIYMNIEYFDCKSGQMLINLNNGEKDGTDQLASAPDSKTKADSKSQPAFEVRPQ
ncbi:MAG: hypothetical protein AAGA96_17440 [Verrucomicrobiota bacterium]